MKIRFHWTSTSSIWKLQGGAINSIQICRKSFNLIFDNRRQSSNVLSRIQSTITHPSAFAIQIMLFDSLEVVTSKDLRSKWDDSPSSKINSNVSSGCIFEIDIFQFLKIIIIFTYYINSPVTYNTPLAIPYSPRTPSLSVHSFPY